MRTLDDKVILITGAGGDIAGAVQESFANAGARPVLIDRDAVRIKGRASSYHTVAIESNMHSVEEAGRVVATIKERTERIDGLVHLVGDVVLGTIHDLSLEDFDRALESNVRTLFVALKAIVPEVARRPEAFIAGMASHEAWGGGAAGAGAFAASKSAVAALLRSLDREIDNTAVDVCIAFPMGRVDTESNRRTPGRVDDLLIHPRAIGDALVGAALTHGGGRLRELPIYPPRRVPTSNM